MSILSDELRERFTIEGVSAEDAAEFESVILAAEAARKSISADDATVLLAAYSLVLTNDAMTKMKAAGECTPNNLLCIAAYALEVLIAQHDPLRRRAVRGEA